ncbi:MAG TPA: Ig-like domain-containing protein, partial [Nitrosarchaeum sp.]|nr:Ig-like domain-containing protein [Nitrosarchaeum sp.]
MNSQIILFSIVFSVFVVGTTSYSFAETSSVEVLENLPVTLVGKGIDPDPTDVLTYKWVQVDGEPVTLSSYDVAEPTFMAPEVKNGEVKVLTFTLTVTDPQGANDSATVEVVVNPVNHVPIVSAGRDQVVFKTINVVTLVSSAVDPDGDSLTYSWKQTSGQPIKLASTTGKYIQILPMGIDFTQTKPLTFELTV